MEDLDSVEWIQVDVVAVDYLKEICKIKIIFSKECPPQNNMAE